MKREVHRTSQAIQDLTDQFVFIGESNLAAAERFLQAAEETFGLLATMPQMGVVRSFGRPELAHLRMAPVRGFEKHLVFYRPVYEGIEIVRVLHAARDLATLLGDGD